MTGIDVDALTEQVLEQFQRQMSAWLPTREVVKFVATRVEQDVQQQIADGLYSTRLTGDRPALLQHVDRLIERYSYLADGGSNG